MLVKCCTESYWLCMTVGLLSVCIADISVLVYMSLDKLQDIAAQERQMRLRSFIKCFCDAHKKGFYKLKIHIHIQFVR